MKKYSEIAIVMTVRKNSTRCKNKLLRNYDGTSLFDIAFKFALSFKWFGPLTP